MSPILTSRALISIIGFLLLAHLSTCRPQSTIDSQDPQDQQSPQELSRLYNSVGNFNNVQPAFSPEDQLPMNRLQMQMLANYVQNNMGGGWGNDPLYRAPETKRQVRYRQCYFNPISCFKK